MCHVSNLSIWAHPRVGGENCVSLSVVVGRLGSSPRGRGKHPILLFLYLTRGLIPAWAGKTKYRPGAARSSWAHPRVGGENSARFSNEADRWGSSPRGRGKLDRARAVGVRLGLIPAWAGKTRLCRTLGMTARAHPRVGGENSGARGGDKVGAGSSPRGRGKLAVCRRGMAVVGLIPAWAGKTGFRRRRLRRRGAHPRVGGENTIRPVLVDVSAGSSPRGRGKPIISRVHSYADGLIPAWAGKTLCHRPGCHRRGAHPRVGGENSV